MTMRVCGEPSSRYWKADLNENISTVPRATAKILITENALSH